jgi:aminomethyltransferase
VTSELKRTPLFALHQELGARLVPFAGWEMPVQYSGVKEEHNATRTAVGLFDVSHMGQLEAVGPGALEEVNRLITNDLARTSDGQGVYTCCCNSEGAMLDDLIVYRLSAEHILIVCNASNRSKIQQHFAGQISSRVRLRAHPERALIAVQGPKALALVGQWVGRTLNSELAPFRSAEFDARLPVEGTSGTQKVRLARTGYTGEDGVEVFCEAEAAEPLFRYLVTHGGLPAGLAARDTLRLEACLRLYGNDMDETTNPLEAGLAWTVKFDKPDFVGKGALVEARAAGLARKLIGFEMIGRGIARAGYPLLKTDGTPLGHCTSGSPSPTTGRNIGLGYVPTSASAVGTEFLVDCRGKTIAARVVTTPFYRRPQLA